MTMAGGDIGNNRSQERRSHRLSAAELEERRKDGAAVIGLIGFSTAGKTWFLNRLKHIYVKAPTEIDLLRDSPAWQVFPQPANDRDLLRRTNDTEDHTFDAPPGGKHRSFIIRDMAGERLESASGVHDRDSEAPAFGNDETLLKDLAECDALIIMMPAEAVLLAPNVADDDRRALLRAKPEDDVEDFLDSVGPPPSTEDMVTEGLRTELIKARKALDAHDAPAPGTPERALIEQRIADLVPEIQRLEDWKLAYDANLIGHFLANLSLLSGVVSMLEAGTPVEQVMEKSGFQIHAFLSKRRARMPVLIALSKADAVLAPDDFMVSQLRALEQRRRSSGTSDEQIEVQTQDIRDRLKQVDIDPAAMVTPMSEGFGQALSRFAWCKVDFVTSFWEHDRTLRVRYGCRHFGVSGVVEWIEWARRIARGPDILRWQADAARFLRRTRLLGRPSVLNLLEDPAQGSASGNAWLRSLLRGPSALVGALFERPNPVPLIATTIVTVAALCLLLFNLDAVSAQVRPAEFGPKLAMDKVYPSHCEALRDATQELRPDSLRTTDLTRAINSHKCENTDAEALKGALARSASTADTAWDRAVALALTANSRKDAVLGQIPAEVDDTGLRAIISPRPAGDSRWSRIARAVALFREGDAKRLRAELVAAKGDKDFSRWTSEVVSDAILAAERSQDPGKVNELRIAYSQLQQAADKTGTPADLIRGWRLWAMLGLIGLSLLLLMRVRGTYRHLYRPRHHEDRPAASGASA